MNHQATTLHIMKTRAVTIPSFATMLLAIYCNIPSNLVDASVLCPGQPAENFCDCDGACEEEPSWCACPKARARSCCNNPSKAPTTTPTTTPNTCDGLNKKECKKVKDACNYGKPKIFGSCKPKKSKNEHECAQYSTENLCLQGDGAVFCKFVDGVCIHVCDVLDKKECKRVKIGDKKACKPSKVENPCKGCNSKSTCS